MVSYIIRRMIYGILLMAGVVILNFSHGGVIASRFSALLKKSNTRSISCGIY